MTDQRIPADVRDALIARNEAREALRQREAELQVILRPISGSTFSIEGVSFKVCGGPKRLYVRRIVSVEKARELREKWRSE